MNGVRIFTIHDKRAMYGERGNLPFSSSLLTFPFLNCLHHEARSLFETLTSLAACGSLALVRVAVVRVFIPAAVMMWNLVKFEMAFASTLRKPFSF